MATVIPDSLPEDTKQRFPSILTGLTDNKSLLEISIELGVSVLVLERDIELWQKSENFDAWLDAEFLRLHPIIAKNDPSKAYDKIVQLKKGRMTPKTDNGRKKADIEAEDAIRGVLDELQALGVFRSEAARLLPNISP